MPKLSTMLFMTYFWRFLLIAILGLTLSFLTVPVAQAAPTSNTAITASDWFKLGVGQMMHETYEQAIESFNQAIELQKDFAPAYSDRCLAYLQLQQYHEAIADCTQALNFAPDNIEAYLNRGIAYYRQGNYPAAIVDHQQVIARKPADFRAHYNLGIAHAGNGNYSEAIVNYNRALTQIPQTMSLLLADIYNDRGLARYELLDEKAAMLDFSMAIRLNEQDDRAYFNRGCLCGRNGDDVCTVRDFSAVIKLNPSNAMAYVNRAVARYNLGYHQGAIADLQQASDLFIHNGEKIAYQKSLHLLQMIQQQISSASEVA